MCCIKLLETDAINCRPYNAININYLAIIEDLHTVLYSQIKLVLSLHISNMLGYHLIY